MGSSQQNEKKAFITLLLSSYRGLMRVPAKPMGGNALEAVADIKRMQAAPADLSAAALPLQDDAGRWNRFGGRLPWDQSAICCNNGTFGGTGRHKTGEDYTAAPNIDHTQVETLHLPRVVESTGCLKGSLAGVLPVAAFKFSLNTTQMGDMELSVITSERCTASATD